MKGSDVVVDGRFDLSTVADRIAIRTLVDAYADCADRRDAEGQMALFTEDTRFLVYLDRRSRQATQEIRGREGLRPVFDDLNQYEATTHFNGQSTIELDGDRATGVTYCLAHHVKAEHGTKSLMIASIRYLDTVVKRDDVWLFAERKLMVDWIETRPLISP
jgi:ketosteroid isomerase-like protein